MNDKTTKMSLANKNLWLVSLLDMFLLRYCSLALHDILGGWNDMKGKVLINKNVFEYVTAHWNHRTVETETTPSRGREDVRPMQRSPW